MAERGAAREEVVVAYSSMRPRYEELADKFAGLLEQLVKNKDIECVLVENRAKTVDSLKGKLSRKEYDDPLEDVTDLAGIRIITYYLEDVERVGELVREHFNVDEDHSVSKSVELGPDQFGYLSDHFIVTLDDKRSRMAEWKHLKGLKAEIQVRTATQHAWASLDHKLQYKSETASDEIKRRLYRLSALFELADEQFAEIERVTRAEGERHVERVRSGDLEATIDITSLASYLNASPTVKDALRVAEAAGWSVREEPDPSDPDRRERDLDDLVRSLHSLDRHRIEDLDALLGRAPEASELLQAVAVREAADPFSGGHANGQAFGEDILNVMVLLLADAPPDCVEKIYGGVTAEAINAAIRGDHSV